jgi:hypothetical protein
MHLVGPTLALAPLVAPTSPACAAARVFQPACTFSRVGQPQMAATRRSLLPVALFTLLGGRLGFLATTKEEFTPPAEGAWNPQAAMEASRAAGACPVSAPRAASSETSPRHSYRVTDSLSQVQSCNAARLGEMQYLLDTSKVAVNAKGAPETHGPVVWVAPIDVANGRPCMRPPSANA